MDETPPAKILRRTLELALDTTRGSALLFELLEGRSVPTTRREVLQVVNGEYLSEVLTEELGDEGGPELIEQLRRQLMPFEEEEPATMEQSLDILVAETRPGEATTTIPTASRAVGVLVLAGSDSFSQRLQACLGSGRVAPVAVGGERSMHSALTGSPAIVVVDASDFPAIDVRVLLEGAESTPTTTAYVLWGVDLPFGRKLSELLDGRPEGGRDWVTLPLSEGIDPLLDLVRSRRRRNFS